MVASAFADVQVTGVFDGRDDGSPDGGEVDGPRPVIHREHAGALRGRCH